MDPNYDFSGWATKFNTLCGDGRTILNNAFDDCDGKSVPMVWNHQHNATENVIGHCLLECRDDGVYTYGYFNETRNGKEAKEFVRHGDINALSIYANRLKQRGKDVLHGQIREVSLVMAGANPGAYIDYIACHSDDGGDGDSAFIYTDEEILVHSEEEEKKVDEEKKEPVAEEKEEPKKASGQTVQDVFNSMTEEQQNVCYALIAMALEEAQGGNKEETEEKPAAKEEDNGDAAEHSDLGGNEDMSHNVFEPAEEKNVIAHSDIEAVFNDWQRYGSMKQAFLEHGLADIEVLFPEAQRANGSGAPEYIKRDTDWVPIIMNGVKKSPMSRLKSIYADITGDEARARGFLGRATQHFDENHKNYRDQWGNIVDADGNRVYKEQEVFGFLKRSTYPTTIYKKQKFDRNDIIDIKDFDVIAWIKQEMRSQLEEEMARAILVGDGRNSSSNDKIDETAIRPIWTAEDLFCIKVRIEFDVDADADTRAKAFIRAAVKARKDYKGSGNPTLFTTEDWLTDMLLMEDSIGHRLYKTEAELATALRVTKIVTAPVLEGLSRSATFSGNTETRYLMGIIVNLNDYTVGTDKGGEVNMFDDFDIDYNQMTYLIETRCSGALMKPYSAITIEYVETTEN